MILESYDAHKKARSFGFIINSETKLWDSLDNVFIKDNESEELGFNIGLITGNLTIRNGNLKNLKGLEDAEINRISQTNNDIGNYDLSTRAYMVNLKIEPRLFLSDSTVVGVFYDAGRVFVEEFDARFAKLFMFFCKWAFIIKIINNLKYSWLKDMNISLD